MEARRLRRCLFLFQYELSQYVLSLKFKPQLPTSFIQIISQYFSKKKIKKIRSSASWVKSWKYLYYHTFANISLFALKTVLIDIKRMKQSSKNSFLNFFWKYKKIVDIFETKLKLASKTCLCFPFQCLPNSMPKIFWIPLLVSKIFVKERDKSVIPVTGIVPLFLIILMKIANTVTRFLLC